MIETGQTMDRTTRSKALTEENLDVFEKCRIFVATNGFRSKLYTKIRKKDDGSKVWSEKKRFTHYLYKGTI